MGLAERSPFAITKVKKVLNATDHRTALNGSGHIGVSRQIGTLTQEVARAAPFRHAKELKMLPARLKIA